LRSISGTFKFSSLSLWVPTGLPQLIARVAAAKKMAERKQNFLKARGKPWNCILRKGKFTFSKDV